MNSNEEIVMSKEQLMELIRVVVFETVKEIKDYEANAVEAMQEQEAWEEQMEGEMKKLRQRASFLAKGIQNAWSCSVIAIDNDDNTKLTIKSEDLTNGNKIIIGLDSVKAVKNGEGREWFYKNSSDFNTAANNAAKWLKSGVSD